MINERIKAWAEDEEIMDPDQNGFRKGRSTLDNLITVMSLTLPILTDASDCPYAVSTLMYTSLLRLCYLDAPMLSCDESSWSHFNRKNLTNMIKVIAY